jgi:protein SCO1
MPRYLRFLLAIVAVMVIAGGAVFAVASSNATPDWLRFWEDDTYEYSGGFYDPPRVAHEVTNAVDQNGDEFTFSQFEGQTVFVYFGYTYCPDYCPATIAEWREVKAELGEDADEVVFVMISVDPERDTPERLNEWLGFWDPEFYGVTMSEEDTDQLTRNWGITATKRDAGSQAGYLVDHDVSTYVIGPDGQLHLTYPLGFAPEDIADDVRHLSEQD